MFIDITKKPSWLWKIIFIIPFLCSSIAYAQAITNIAVNDDESLLLTAQEKVARLWEIDTGKVIREFSIPEDVFTFRRESKYSGNIYATEFVDNNIVLAGVSSMIYFFDLESGKSSYKLYSGFDSTVMDMCKSPDGKFFAATLGEKGLLIWRLKEEEGELLIHDEDYNNEYVWECGFLENNRLISTSGDGFLRLYDMNFGLIGKLQLPDKTLSSLLSIHPDKEKFVISRGKKWEGFITIGEVKDSKIHLQEDVRKRSINDSNFTRAMCWSADGKYLYWDEYDDEGLASLQIQEIAHPRKRHAIPISSHTILEIYAMKNGNIIVTTNEPGWLLLDKNGNVIQHNASPI